MSYVAVDIPTALNGLYDEVFYSEFYREIFPEGELEERGVYEKGKYHAVAISVEKGSKRTKRYSVTDDLEIIEDLVATDDFCLMSPISYAGLSRKSENARFLYAIAIDLDGVESLENWNVFLGQIERGRAPFGLPRPTFLVSSGTGIHIYYVFEKPIPLFPNIVKQLEVLKRRLTWQAWTQGASEEYDNVQYESLFQGFRMVGSITKTGGRCRAFRTGERVTIEYLNSYVPEDYQTKDFAYKSDLLLKDAKEKYPEWYQRRVVEKKPRGAWTCKRDLYDWWLRRSREALQGHRYWYVMTLATYAVKCGIPLEELEEDAYGLVDSLSSRGSEPFTTDDVLHALEAYNDSYITYPIHTIETRTGMRIERNKRNGRTQAQHMAVMRAIQGVVNPDWREEAGRPTGEKDKQTRKAGCGRPSGSKDKQPRKAGSGRPVGSGTAQEKVAAYRQQHPDGRKIDCVRDTGLSKPTVYKWWDSCGQK